MTLNAEVAKSDLAFEAGLPEPDFGLLRDDALLKHLVKRLTPFGGQLGDLRLERGNGSVGDHSRCRDPRL